MKVVNILGDDVTEGTTCKRTMFYSTPRAFLVEMMDGGELPHLMRWNEKGTTFKFGDLLTVAKLWGSYALENPTGHEAVAVFISDLLGTVDTHKKRHRKKGYQNLKFATKSTDLRKYVDDLVPGKLSEWMVRFLLEKSRLDWICWEDEDNLEFKILDVDNFGNTFLHVNKLNARSPRSLMSTILSCYRNQGIITEIDKATRHYKFDFIWYSQEIRKQAKDGEVQFKIPYYRQVESLEKFPLLTMPIDIRRR